MPCFQPKIMVVNGLDQNRAHASTVPSQRIREYLVAYQRRILGRCLVFFKAFTNSFCKRLLCTGNAGNPVLVAEDLHSILLRIGDHANLNVRCGHSLKPLFHFFCWQIRGIRHNGIIEIHHQQLNLMAFQKRRCNIRQLIRHKPWQQGKRHTLDHTFIYYGSIIAHKERFVHGNCAVSGHDSGRISYMGSR